MRQPSAVLARLTRHALRRSAFAPSAIRAYDARVDTMVAALVRSSAMLALLLFGTSAQAADCVRSLRILNSVQMQSTTDRTVMLVPVRIDGSEKKLPAALSVRFRAPPPKR
jgi:hypothetical protein